MKKGPLAAIAVVLVLSVLLIGPTIKDNKTTTTPTSSSSSSSTPSTSNSNTSSQAVPTNSVNMADMKFAPAVITIPLGATVHWNNNDSVTHTITADDGSFNSGNIASKSNYTHSFSTAGTFKYQCSIHEGMTGTVIVREQ